jgi:hypothetical protein
VQQFGVGVERFNQDMYTIIEQTKPKPEELQKSDSTTSKKWFY